MDKFVNFVLGSIGLFILLVMGHLFSVKFIAGFYNLLLDTI